MKVDFFQMKVGTSLSGKKASAETECVLHIHTSWNFLITFEMYNVFKSKYAVRFFLLCGSRRLSFPVCCSLILTIILTCALPFPMAEVRGWLSTSITLAFPHVHTMHMHRLHRLRTPTPCVCACAASAL